VANLLIIEDEPDLRAAEVRGLAKLPDLCVADCGTLGEALSILDATPQDLVICDIDLPDRSGIELLGELGRRSLNTPVLFVSAYLKAYRAQIPPHANVEVLEKPVALDTLRQRVMEKLLVTPAARTPFGVPDYLQLACMGKHSLRIDIGLPDGGTANVMVQRGEVWSARDAQGTGVEAFCRIAFQKDARVDCRGFQDDPGPRNIQIGWEQLLMDAARVFDEAQRGRGGASAAAVADDDPLGGLSDFGEEEAPAPPVPPAPVAAAAPQAALPANDEAFKRVLDEGVEALLSKSYPDALSAFQRARELRPSDPLVAANLKRLAQLGFGPQPPAKEKP
jgi:CheY-like chemotaxis protein